MRNSQAERMFCEEFHRTNLRHSNAKPHFCGLAFVFKIVKKGYTTSHEVGEKMTDKNFGKRVKQRREELGLSQEQLAAKIGVSSNYISTVECGTTFPRFDKLIKIINGLEISADPLFQDSLEFIPEDPTTLLVKRIVELTDDEQERIIRFLDYLTRR